MMEKLSIKEKSEEELRKAKEEAEAQLEEQSLLTTEAVKAAEQEKQQTEKKALKVQKFMKRIALKEKIEWISIGSNILYTQEDIFKIGSTIKLSTRIPGYNTGRPKPVDNWYYAWAKQCYNSKDVDNNHIQKLLVDFKLQDPDKINEKNKGEI